MTEQTTDDYLKQTTDQVEYDNQNEVVYLKPGPSIVEKFWDGVLNLNSNLTNSVMSNPTAFMNEDSSTATDHYNQAQTTVISNIATGYDPLRDNRNRPPTNWSAYLSGDDKALQELTNFNVLVGLYRVQMKNMGEEEITKEHDDLRLKTDRTPEEEVKFQAHEGRQADIVAQNNAFYAEKQKRIESNPAYYYTWAQSLSPNVRAKFLNDYASGTESAQGDPISVAKMMALRGNLTEPTWEVQLQIGQYPPMAAETVRLEEHDISKDKIVNCTGVPSMSEATQFMENQNKIVQSEMKPTLDKFDQGVKDAKAAEIIEKEKKDPLHNTNWEGLSEEALPDRKKYDLRMKLRDDWINTRVNDIINARGDIASRWAEDPRTEEQIRADITKEFYSNAHKDVFGVADKAIETKEGYRPTAVKYTVGIGPVEQSSTQMIKNGTMNYAKYGESFDSNYGRTAAISLTGISKNPSNLFMPSGSLSYMWIVALDGQRVSEAEAQIAFNKSGEGIGGSFYVGVGGEISYVTVGERTMIVAGAGLGFARGISVGHTSEENSYDRYKQIMQNPHNVIE